MTRILQSMVGRTYGRRTVLEAVGGGHLRVRCECGHEATVQGSRLRRGLQQQCQGCAFTQHGLSDDQCPEYRAWASARQRYPAYREPFSAFMAELGPRPSRTHAVTARHGVDVVTSARDLWWATRSEIVRRGWKRRDRSDRPMMTPQRRQLLEAVARHPGGLCDYYVARLYASAAVIRNVPQAWLRRMCGTVAITAEGQRALSTAATSPRRRS